MLLTEWIDMNRNTHEEKEYSVYKKRGTID